MEEDKLVIERVFDAPRERVWEVWTDPEQIKKWWGPEGFSAPSIEIDLRVGGKFVYAMHGPAGSEWDKDMYSAGEFKEIVPMEKIVYTDWFSDENGNQLPPTDFGMSPDFPAVSETTVLFEDTVDGKTKLTLISHLPDDEAARQAVKDSGSVEGWNSSLNKFAEALK